LCFVRACDPQSSCVHVLLSELQLEPTDKSRRPLAAPLLAWRHTTPQQWRCAVANFRVLRKCRVLRNVCKPCCQFLASQAISCATGGLQRVFLTCHKWWHGRLVFISQPFVTLVEEVPCRSCCWDATNKDSRVCVPPRSSA
jgi:hypothetical protein